LKQLLTSAPILRIADPNEDFVVCIDACKEGLGGVLNHNGFVICYESRKLKEHERNYAIHDLELAAIVHALKKWRNYVGIGVDPGFISKSIPTSPNYWPFRQHL
jgi:hypothetical protein